MEELSENDLLVMRALKRIKKTPVETLAQETGLKVEAALQSAYFLQTSSLAQVLERVDTVYELTDEGLSYAEKGLPERKSVV